MKPLRDMTEAEKRQAQAPQDEHQAQIDRQAQERQEAIDRATAEGRRLRDAAICAAANRRGLTHIVLLRRALGSLYVHSYATFEDYADCDELDSISARGEWHADQRTADWLRQTAGDDGLAEIRAKIAK